MTALASLPPKVGVVIPALNEADAIGQVVSSLRSKYDYPIVVVDDCSEDETSQIALQAGAQVLPLAARLGAWGATQTGIRYFLQQNFDVVVTLDADGQHEPESLPALLEPILNGNADVTIGTCPGRVSRLRLLAWMMMKTTSGLRMEDITSGFRVYNRQALDELADPRATLFDYQDVGVLLCLQAADLKLLDVPVQMQERCGGGSRIFHSWLVVGRYMLQTLILGLAKRRLGTRMEGKV
ncbi:glycosyltransferase family 2 protein [Gilvimarinus chinensis]|uniref:glycosyltransferase family 2 protein n=1 Tax=Gilvimarinus chinensis TaxID=396005 RepID=UPI00037963D4|nr:glycosyltransferase family 2 protein [Gilvimarinus chinensis]